MNTNLKAQMVYAEGVRFAITNDEGEEIGRAFLYVMNNDLHEEPFGFLEDVYVSEQARGQGVGSQLIDKVIETARQRGCYKIVATSRFEREQVHTFYEKFGFENRGYEFRKDLV